MMMLMLVTVAVLIMLMMMLMLVLVAVAVLVVLMMMLMLVAVAVLVMLMMMLVLIVMVVVMVVMRGNDGVYVDQLRGMLNGVHDDLAVDVVPGGGDQTGFGVQAADEIIGGFQLFLGDLLRAAEDNGFGALDLIFKEFAEVLEIHLALARVNDRGAAG